MVGMSIEGMKDTETLGDYKTKLKKLLKKKGVDIGSTKINLEFGESSSE
jgi:hypothetical protein